jgi:hypothetical protein
VHEEHPDQTSLVKTTEGKPDYCTKAVNRLKAGPAPIPKVICNGTNFTDTTFEGIDTIAWQESDATSFSTYTSYINYGYISFMRW